VNDWINRQRYDPFVRKRNDENVIARSYFKIEEIFEEFFKKQTIKRVLDLGSAPGGWSQYFNKHKYYVIGIDLLPMKIAINEFYQQDILNEIPNFQKVDMICSDIAPNLSGNKTVDNAIMCDISEKVTKCIDTYLLKGGSFVTKVFMGDSFNLMQSNLKSRFSSVKVFKPKSSRSESSEIYIVAKSLK
jgi:23S rRNA (uridine2552-2'-O)-methyltransferase